MSSKSKLRKRTKSLYFEPKLNSTKKPKTEDEAKYTAVDSDVDSDGNEFVHEDYDDNDLEDVDEYDKDVDDEELDYDCTNISSIQTEKFTDSELKTLVNLIKQQLPECDVLNFRQRFNLIDFALISKTLNKSEQLVKRTVSEMLSKVNKAPFPLISLLQSFENQHKIELDYNDLPKNPDTILMHFLEENRADISKKFELTKWKDILYKGSELIKLQSKKQIRAMQKTYKQRLSSYHNALESYSIQHPELLLKKKNSKITPFKFYYNELCNSNTVPYNVAQQQWSAVKVISKDEKMKYIKKFFKSRENAADKSSYEIRKSDVSFAQEYFGKPPNITSIFQLFCMKYFKEHKEDEQSALRQRSAAFKKLSTEEKEILSTERNAFLKERVPLYNSYIERIKVECPDLLEFEELRKTARSKTVSPRTIFYKQRSTPELTYDDMIQKWKILAKEDKIKYIKEFFKERNKSDDKSIYTIANPDVIFAQEYFGRPPNIVCNAYLLFTQRFMKETQESLKMATKAYKELTEKAKQTLNDEYKELLIKRQPLFESYINKIKIECPALLEFEKPKSSLNELINESSLKIDSDQETEKNILKAKNIINEEEATAFGKDSPKPLLLMKPPRSVYRYYCKNLCKNDGSAKRKWLLLSKKKKNKIEKQYKNLCTEYFENLKTHLQDMRREEIPGFLEKYNIKPDPDTSDDDEDSGE